MTIEQWSWLIQAEEENERIDKFIAQKNSDWSRTKIQQWIKDGFVTVNEKQVKSNYKLEAGDKVVLNVPEAEPLEIVPENIPLEVIYEDEDVLVINKPRGMVVHPAPGHTTGTLVNALMYHCEQLSQYGGLERAGIVHRLDKDTSGLLVVAKNDVAHKKLAEQFKEKTAGRIYYAIVHGNIPHDHGTIDAPIGRDPLDRQKMTVTDKNAKEAVTHFTVLERFKDYTYVLCQLETGRTHQIRVHMKYIGHPVAGDKIYGPKITLPIDGQALHAGKLSFCHPKTNEKLTFQSEIPEDMEALLRELRRRE